MEKSSQEFFVYVVLCSDLTYYCGYTKDLQTRIKQHNTLKAGAKYTKTRRPVKLVYFEQFFTQKEAMTREIEIKRLPRVKKALLINSACIDT